MLEYIFTTQAIESEVNLNYLCQITIRIPNRDVEKHIFFITKEFGVKINFSCYET